MDSIFILLRIIIATLVLILLPGYIASLVFFPQNKAFDFSQRLAVSGSIGLVLTIIMGTLLIEAEVGFYLSTYLPMLLLITLFFAFIAKTRSNATIGATMPQWAVSAKSVALWLLTIGIITSATIMLLNSAHEPYQAEQYTEFYVLDGTQKIPYTPPLDSDEQDIKLKVGIISHEYAKTSYQIQAKIGDRILFSSSDITLADNEQWQDDLSIEPPKNLSETLPLEIHLFKDGQDLPYRNLHLWLNEPSNLTVDLVNP